MRSSFGGAERGYGRARRRERVEGRREEEVEVAVVAAAEAVVRRGREEARELAPEQPKQQLLGAALVVAAGFGSAERAS